MPTQAEFWDRAAVKYSKSKIGDLENYHQTLERTQSYLKSSDHALEIGCGTGSTALLLAPSVKTLVATDVSQKMIDIAKSKKSSDLQNLHFVASDVEQSCWDNPGQDVIMAHNLLHLLKNKRRCIDAAHSALKPGGLFISKTPCLGDGGWYFGPLIGIMRFFGKAPFVARISIHDLDADIEAAGFEIIETQTKAGKVPTRYIVAKKI